mgnify:CR=1 FL=1
MLLEVGSPIVTVIWNQIQNHGQCCGMDGQQDWLDSYFGKIPPSCCNKGKLENNWILIKIFYFSQSVLFLILHLLTVPNYIFLDNLKNRTEVARDKKEVTRFYCQEGESNFPGCEMRARKYAHLTGIVFFIVLIFQFTMIAFTVSFIKILAKHSSNMYA